MPATLDTAPSIVVDAAPPPELPSMRARAQIASLNKAIIAQVDAKLISRAEGKAALAARGITLERWADALRDGLDAKEEYIRLRAAEELSRFERMTAEDVALYKTAIGDTGDGQHVHNHLHLPDLPPDAVPAFVAALRSPRVMEAVRAELAAQGGNE